MRTPVGETERRRVLFMARVPDGEEASFLRNLHPLVIDRQWNPEWTITKVYLADLPESRRMLGEHGPCSRSHNLFIWVSATDQDTLINEAIPKIRDTLRAGHATRRRRGRGKAAPGDGGLMGHVLIGAMDVNGPG